LSGAAPQTPATESKAVSCEECFFRQMLLCALPGNVPCPTYRPAAAATLRTPAEPPPRHLTAVAAA